MPALTSHSPSETEALGEEFGRAAKHGWVIALSGDLGAGKTQFVKGLARGLDISARVHSPTFTLVAEYGGGRLKLFHLDLYRLETPEQILTAGIEEFLEPDGVAVIEWVEKLENLKAGSQSLLTSSPAIKKVQIEILSETDRKITYDDFSA
ncbi:MAG TPA: tRNA (adenosine(37)-N6)-threonylcarbamoyltransferase complex ATPase subunit type 1 TsaE [Verrucomicrobiae bacterium]|nr:tRNA (adenosine(37)-N6)-threonylcarbamoyltransferase complex ATPase subunit type 1 TsaE [Verrucomicrobiae bacterium]